MSNEIDKKGLLGALNEWIDDLKEFMIPMEWGEENEQAYKQIVALIKQAKKEVTEEWVRKWAESICEGVRIHKTLPMWQGVMTVQKMLTEIGVEVKKEE